MASDISASSCASSEQDDQLGLSSEEEVQAVESTKKRAKKLPAQYCNGGDDHTKSDKLEIELKGSKFASI